MAVPLTLLVVMVAVVLEVGKRQRIVEVLSGIWISSPNVPAAGTSLPVRIEAQAPIHSSDVAQVIE